MQKDDLNVHVIQNRNWCSPKSDGWFFFYFILSEDLSTGRILSEKNMGLRGWFLKKTPEAMYAEFTERAEAATSSHSVTGNFLQCIYSVCG